MERITSDTEYSATPNIQSSGLSRVVARPRLEPMPKSGPHRKLQKRQPRQWGKNSVKSWRVFRNLTVEQLSDLTGLSTGNISAIENRRQGYSDESLEKLAHALRTTPGALLDVDPMADGEDSFWAMWDKVGDTDRETLRLMASRLVETGKGRK
jgi:transcriptional regulator with XRE-family HTH domain